MRTRKLHASQLVNVLLFIGVVSGQSLDAGSGLPRDGRQLPAEGEEKYQFELSFPVDSDEATNVNNGRRQRIESLLQSILLENQALVSSLLLTSFLVGELKNHQLIKNST